MNKTLISIFALLALMVTNCFAQGESFINTAELQTRIDWQRDQIGGDKRDSKSGFKGRYLNLILKGDITDNISYAYRQRFSKPFGTGKFFDATDWLYLTWKATDKLAISGGKEIVALGGFEYDYAPIDVYGATEFWNNIPCYQFGGSVAYSVSSHDQLTAQLVQSPFRNDSTDLYAYNLRWNGNHGALSTIWSVSMLEYQPGKYINYIVLGNQFDFGKGHIIIDYQNRYAKGNGTAFFGDFTLNTEIHVQPTKQVNVFAKYAIDQNLRNKGDYCVFAGTKQHHAGIGVEYFPLKGRKDLRLHANAYHTWGKNTNPAGTNQDKQTTFNLGLTWKADLLNIRKLIKK